MLNNYKKTLMVLFACILAHTANAQELLHYWNFNTAATFATPSQTTGGAAITANLGTVSVMESGTGQDFDIANLNAQGTDVAGTHLRFNNPLGGELTFALPTTGYEDLVVKFATRRSTQGASIQKWSYSLDGTTYVDFQAINPVATTPTLITLNFSEIVGADNNANFKVKVAFEQGTGGLEGNNRFDNFTAQADELSTPELIHYWNFNSTVFTAETSFLVPGGSVAHIAGGTSEFISGTGQDFGTLNAQNAEEAGTHIRFNNPVGGGIVFSLPTTGYNQPVVKFTTRRSGSGAYIQKWAYSLDGATYVDFQTVMPVAAAPELVTLDFSAIAGASNNANFKIKVTFEQGGGGLEGNNRFDNLTVFATPSENTADTTAPGVTIAPANNAGNVAVNTPITIAFNENVRLVNDTAITNTNIDALVEVRLNGAAGALVPFDATFANNTISIVPATALANAQVYYVALVANAVEDTSNNAVATAVTSTFTTIAVQTSITAGDMLFTAYRMNATGTEDEIALVTFVDIAPGTFINLTDAKYTTNTPAQCASGIVWTATTCVPAGTVITIQASALVANTGTVAGSGFGLSSGGDQVIVYTGTNIAPNYITALTSNGWAATNASCSGSVSMIPAGLTAANSSDLSTAPGSADSNTVNAYYNGTMAGTPAALKVALLNPANWVGVAGATAPQTWPVWAFPSSPTVQSAAVVNNTTIQLVFNNVLNATSAANLANYTGVAGLETAVLNGNTVTLTYSTAFAAGSSNALIVNGVTDINGVAMACPYTFAFSYNTTVSLASEFITVDENAGTLNFVINLANPAAGSVNLVVKPAPWSTATAGEDFTLPATQTLTFTGSSALTQSIAIPIIDDTTAEEFSEYFVLSLESPVGLAITGETMATVYIKDNDIEAPQPNHDIELDYITSFDPSGANESTCEIVVYDAASKKLFATSAVEGRLDIINFANPEAPVTVGNIDMNTYGGVTSVAVKNGIVAVASPNADETVNGKVVFFDTNGTFVKQVTVGALPDNISFTPDGTKVLTANEGQPNADYSVDPEGSVSIIDISGGVANLTQANVNTLLFSAYNSESAEAALIASGVRKLKQESTMSQDFEPEYITTSADSQKAWVTLQENNAIAEINLATGTITDVWALGTKDVSLPGNGFDISDNNNEILIANWPIQAYYMPDGAATYSVGGVNYVVTANEGDEKEYTGFVERTTIGAATYNLDATAYPQAAMLKKSYNAGRFRVTAFDGKNDAGTAYEDVYALGSRSFSIFNADTKEIVFDSGNDFEVYTATEPSISALFNADSEDNSRKGRSRAKGPEPEGVTFAHIADRTFAFIGLERVGGVMVYDVTDPNNVAFVDYKNSRTVSAYGGDNGPEGIIYISQEDSPNDTPYVIVANEISGTLTVYGVNIENLGTGDYTHQNTFVVFPNPSENGIVYFNRMASVEVFDYTGKMVYAAKDALTIDTSKLATGIYLVKTADGITKKLIVK